MQRFLTILAAEMDDAHIRCLPELVHFGFASLRNHSCLWYILSCEDLASYMMSTKGCCALKLLVGLLFRWWL